MTQTQKMSAAEQKKLLEIRMREEYIKCATDPKYFLRNYAKIQHPVRGKIAFGLFKYQENTIDDFLKHLNNIVLKGRQIGLSTVVAGYSLWLMTFHEHKKILVIATKQDSAKNLVQKVQFMHDSLPSWMRARVTTRNKLSMTFGNGSEIKAVASSLDAGRSESLSLLILDEAAHIENAGVIWTAASSTITTGGKAIILSTPNGQGNFFHEMWLKAEAGENDFNPIKLDWRVHPERTQEWRDNETKRMGELAAIQEHDASFIHSGNNVIPSEIVERFKEAIKKNNIQPVHKTGLMDTNLWIWKMPEPGRTYIVCADVARGDGADNSGFHILDLDTNEQVAEYKGKMPTKEFGQFLTAWAIQYNNALLIIENATVGWNVIQEVIDSGYRNLFYMSVDMHYVDVHQQLNLSDPGTLKAGFSMTTRTRPLVISRLCEYMLEESIKINSLRLLAEMETFIWKNGKAQAIDGKNDDLIMALAIGLWVRDTALRLRLEGIELTKSSLANIGYRETKLYMDNPMSRQAARQWEFDVNGNKEDLLWLLG